jgi:hypothetical protein
MNRTISLIALMAFLAAPAFAAGISAPEMSTPSAPGSAPAPAPAPAVPGAPVNYAALPPSELTPLAEKGDAAAQYALAEHYGQRNSLDADFSVATKWYAKAADQNNKDAQYKLGLLYQEALGVSQSYTMAYFWVSLAAKDSTNKVWLQKRDDLEKLLKPEQVTAIKAKVATWKPGAADAAPAPTTPDAPPPDAPGAATPGIPGVTPPAQ